MFLRILSFTILLTLTTISVFGQDITIGDDGIVRCKDVEIGTKQTIFGDEYEVVNRDSLIVRRDQGVDLSKMCVSNVTNMRDMFRGTSFNQDIGNWDVSSVTNMSYMFYESDFNQDIGNWDVSSVTDMSGMFSGTYSNFTPFNSLWINDWDVSSVTDMSYMFQYSKFYGYIGSWDVSSVTNMSYMFYGKREFNNWGFNNWDVSSVTDMSYMFAFSLVSPQNGGKIEEWDVSSVTNMEYMFTGATYADIDIGGWDVSSVTNMRQMFSGATRFNQYIGDWDVSSVRDMWGMFSSTDLFNQDIGKWDVSSVMDMGYMFFVATSFNQNLTGWCVENITTRPFGFAGQSSLSESNQPIWGTCGLSTQFYLDNNGKTIVCKDANLGESALINDVLYTKRSVDQITPSNASTSCTSDITDMSGLFKGKEDFNENISHWDVSSVTDMNEMFYDARDFNSDISRWDVSSVTDMSGMFVRSFEFSQDIGDWDVSSVKNMNGMFVLTFEFDQPIGIWELSSVNSMRNMFYGSNFNQKIGNWDVSSVTDMHGMFSEASFFDQDISNWCVPLISSAPPEFSANSPLKSNYKPIWGTCPGTPPTPTPLIPQDESTDISKIRQFKWSSDTLSTHYQLQVFEGTDPVVIDTLVTDTSFTNTEPFKSNTTYNWRVKGINQSDSLFGEPKTSEWSSVVYFTTGIRTSTEPNTTPSSFSLNQNYPNPFNPTTTITYSLPQSGMVTLNVYDITGRFITTLVDGIKGVGTHTVQFVGSSLSSGMYVYTLETEGYRQTRQMMLVK